VEKIGYTSTLTTQRNNMCNFELQSEETKLFLHLFLTKAAAEVGGVNFLLSLIEAMRKKKPNPLMLKESQVASNNTIIRWNKVIFQDKVELLEKVLRSQTNTQEKDHNILSNIDAKQKKNVLNMIRTLAPVEFVVTPQNPNDGNGFSFKVFDTIEDERVIINPIFAALFFCSTEFTKKALKYTPKS